ncbi:MAG: hypothetical protein AB1817_03640 [Chloroflexota bacterium]
MEIILKEVNAVPGVIGSFVCLPDGKIATQVVPEKYAAEDLNLAARVTSQTFQALELSGQRVSEAALLFTEGRMVLKNFRGGTLIILCARNINIPLLNLTANVAVKKLVAETRSTKPATPAPAEIKPPAPTSAPTTPRPVAPAPTAPSPATPASVVTPAPPPLPAPVILPEVALPPLVEELEKEARQIIQTATRAQLSLWIMDPIALWHRCQGRRRLLTVPQQRQFGLAGQSERLPQIAQLLGNLGYQRKTPANAPPTTRRLLFTDLRKSLNLVLMLDTFEMYHRFDFKPLLHTNDPIAPATVLALTRLQLVEMPDEALSDLAALFIEYDVSLVPKANQIDASQITALCVDDWGWYKTISMNLEQLIYFAEDSLLLAERNVVIERARRLKSGMDASPKSLRWQARARLGETVRWYETPVEIGAAARPDMAIGS